MPLLHSETVLQDRRMEADAVSKAGLPLLRSVVATVRNISDGIVCNFFLGSFLSHLTKRLH